jgi:hypothetical protein
MAASARLRDFSPANSTLLAISLPLSVWKDQKDSDRSSCFDEKARFNAFRLHDSSPQPLLAYSLSRGRVLYDAATVTAPSRLSLSISSLTLSFTIGAGGPERP